MEYTVSPGAARQSSKHNRKQHKSLVPSHLVPLRLSSHISFQSLFSSFSPSPTVCLLCYSPSSSLSSFSLISMFTVTSPLFVFLVGHVRSLVVRWWWWWSCVFMQFLFRRVLVLTFEHGEKEGTNCDTSILDRTITRTNTVFVLSEACVGARGLPSQKT